MSLIPSFLALALVLSHGRSWSASAGPGPDPAGGAPSGLTPQGAVALAVTNHPQLRAAAAKLGAAEADRAVALSGYLPRLDLTENLARSTNPVFVFASKLGQERFTPSDFAIEALNRPEPFTNAATRVALSQNIWDAGRTALGLRATRIGADASRASSARVRDEVAFGALRSFWDAVLADEMLEVTRTAQEAAQANLDLVSRQVEAGLAVPSDRMSTEVRLAEVRALRIRAEQGALVARAGLRQALGLADDRAFDLAPPNIEPPAQDGEAGARVAEALAARPDLAALDRAIEAARVGERIAWSGMLPELGVGAAYEWNGHSAFGADGRNWTVAATIRIPVFDGLETRARAARARADRELVEALRDSLAEAVRLETRAAWADRVSAAERLRVAESSLGAASEALRIVRERYQEGMALVVELLGAEAARTSALGSRAAAARDLAVADAGLDLATGRRLDGGEDDSRGGGR